MKLSDKTASKNIPLTICLIEMLPQFEIKCAIQSERESQTELFASTSNSLLCVAIRGAEYHQSLFYTVIYYCLYLLFIVHTHFL